MNFEDHRIPTQRGLRAHLSKQRACFFDAGFSAVEVRQKVVQKDELLFKRRHLTHPVPNSTSFDILVFYQQPSEAVQGLSDAVEPSGVQFFGLLQHAGAVGGANWRTKGSLLGGLLCGATGLTGGDARFGPEGAPGALHGVGALTVDHWSPRAKGSLGVLLLEATGLKV
ncbi:hypothetical protein N7490_006158 [Penicillium lividum]|nr:hypothetical protein N7490_006158 [Penicillium lividum]